MLLTDIGCLKSSDELAVIINVNTKLMTTLALVSTLRHAGMPVLLVDCESKDGSFEYFLRLMDAYKFDLISLPQKSHGRTLDWLFTHLPARKVLLVDSDLEILDTTIIKIFKEFIDNEQTFGCGFINGPGWLTDHAGAFLESAYYQERIWMPLTLLKSSFVKESINAGHSFEATTVYNDFTPSYRVSKKIADWRNRYSWFKKWMVRAPRIFRRSYYGHKPSLIYCDTGANIYQYLRYSRELWFAGLPEPYHNRYVTHFFGTTRNALGEEGPHSGARHKENIELARRRLNEAYGIIFQG